MCNSINIAAVTETWFHDVIFDSFISVDGYEVHRKDRQLGRGGGVCIYLSQFLKGKRCLDLKSPHFECMWVWLRPGRLPKPLSRIAVCVVYHPPDKSIENQSRLRDYLINSPDVTKNKYPDSGIVILVDFHNLSISDIISSHDLKQIVQPTRGEAILDLVITNLDSFYCPPKVSAPLGSSDHNLMLWSPCNYNNVNNKCVTRPVCRFPESRKGGFGL